MHANQSNGTDTPPSKKGRSKETKKVITLDVLKHCTVFVDVRTDAGDDAGELFIQMLRDMGARVSSVHLPGQKSFLRDIQLFRF